MIKIQLLVFANVARQTKHYSHQNTQTKVYKTRNKNPGESTKNDTLTDKLRASKRKSLHYFTI